jgi:hypothetical protein
MTSEYFTEKPTLVGYEWRLLCPCGARIELNSDDRLVVGLDDVDAENYPYLTERVREVAGERTFDCYDCSRELTVSIEETGIAKWGTPDE